VTAKRWIVPTLIVIALAIPVIADLYEMVRDRGRAAAPLDLDLLDDGVLHFEGRDLLIDLRAMRTAAGRLPVAPSHRLGEDWASQERAGRWTLADRAELDVRMMTGGQRSLMLQCRPDRRRKPPPLLSIDANGVDCGTVQLERELSVVHVELPEGAISTGHNRLVLELRSSLQPAQAASGRTLMVRRLVLARAIDADFEEIVARRPPVVKTSETAVRVQAPGTLFLEFDVPRPGAAVKFQCGFPRVARGACCDVVVGRWFPDKSALDAVGRVRVTGGRGRNRSYRIALGDHSGPSLLRINVDEASAEAGLELRSPRLIAAGS
jgi:hypothetical protein